MFRKGISKSALKALAVIARVGAINEFYLAGGTAAALQVGHRLSIDLDFFSVSDFDAANLSQMLERAGVELGDVRISPGTLHCNIAQTKISFLHYPYPILEKLKSFEGIKIASLLDITLMKITAIASRGNKKDFIDLYFALKSFTLPRLFEEFSCKYPIKKLDPYHYLKSLTYFDDAENDPMPRMLVPCKWEKVKQTIEENVAKLTL